MKKLIIGILVIGTSLLTVRNLLLCNKFADLYYFSPYDLQLRLIEAIHNDSGIPIFIVRLFHNKILGTTIDIIRSYVLYWDIRFLITLIGVAGVVLAVIGAYTLIRGKKSRVLLSLLMVLLILPLVQILFPSIVPFSIWVIGYAAFLLAFAGFGITQRKMKVWEVLLISSMLLLTLWWQSVYTPINLGFCLR